MRYEYAVLVTSLKDEVLSIAMIEKARMIKRRFENIVTYLKHRVTNAASESLNSKIQWVKYTARGFRNKNNFVTAIYFHCGGLDLMPSTH